MTTSAPNISVTRPVGQAIERARRMLFQPFDLGKWFVIGFCAWLAGLGERGLGSGGDYDNGQHKGLASAHQALDETKEWVAQNLYWLVPVVGMIVVVVLALWGLLIWLNSRGRFMFLHCVAVDRAEVTEPWRRYEREANSLFGFRLILWLCQMVFLLPLLAWAGFIGVEIIERETVSPGDVMLLTMAGLGLLVFLCVFGIVGKLMKDFVVPIQYLRGGGCVAAWRELLRLVGSTPGEFILYVLFSIALGIAIFVLVVAVVLATCCIACCVLAIPYIGTVVMLPLLIFQRAYSAYFLAQFGAGYDVFAAG